MGRRWHGIGMVEGRPTGDGRFIEAGALTWADPPLPLTWQKASDEGHLGEVVVGTVDTIDRRGEQITASGELLDTPEAEEVAPLIEAQVVGLSAQLDDATEAIVGVDEDGEVVPEDEIDQLIEDEDLDTLDHLEPQLRVEAARVRNFCVVITPAFVECTIELDDAMAPLAASGWNSWSRGDWRDRFPRLKDIHYAARAETFGATPVHHTGLDEGDWDAAAQQAKLTSPMSLDTARAMYAWYDSEAVDGDQIAASNCSLPHHVVGDNGAPGLANRTALGAAMAALGGGRGGTSIPEAERKATYDHLAAHYTDNDLEPPEYVEGDSDEAVAAGACCLACQATGGSCADEPVTHVPTAAASAEARQFAAWRRAGHPGGSAVAAAHATALAAGEGLTYAEVKRLFGFFVRSAAHRQDQGWHRGDDGFPSPGRVAWAAHGGDAAYAWARGIIEATEGVTALRRYQDTAWSLAASASSLLHRPPTAWFSDPGLDGPTPLTVTPDGRVFGHLAPWNSCHMSVQDRCLKPPRSATGYAHFHQGRVVSAEGSVIPTGKITMATVHASLGLRAHATIVHYEHTGAVVADVAAGEDAYGIWVAGALRPDVTKLQRTQIERSAISGDWRMTPRGMELVAALAVNVPGFPVVRARVASGQPEALVASGVVEADRRDRVRPGRRHHDARFDAAAEAIAASIGLDRKSQLAALVASVHGEG